MNVLQTLQAPVRFLVTLNHADVIDERKILRRVQYDHPVYLPAGVAAQKRHREVNGAQRTYYCGAYWRYGFHAARCYGCRVTTTTISKEQYEFARQRVAAAGLADRIELRLDDYRDLQGQYDVTG